MDVLENYDSVVLRVATLSDVQSIEQFADATLRDDFFFRTGHWLSLLADSRVQLFTVHLVQSVERFASEILGVAVLYNDSTLHNLFLAQWARNVGLGSAVMVLLTPMKVRVKTNMKTGDPSEFYKKLGYTVELGTAGKGRHIKILGLEKESN